MNDFRLTLVQTDPVWGDIQANLRRVRELVEGVGETDLIVLPEMFSTGFITDPSVGTEPDGGESLALMKEIAARKDAAVAGSVAVRESEGGTYRNRFYFVKPSGEVSFYDKHHLFTYSGEHHRYTAGKEKVVVEWRGVKILLQVCYDLRFPVFARNGLLKDGTAEYDLALYVASWPEARIGAWDALLKARAIENQCYLAAVNRVGNDPKNRYVGHSQVFSPAGELLSICKENKEDVANCVISITNLLSFRKSFPVLEDADSHKII
ncbi:MAG: amidohydrolase [Bacteroidales bacterium]|nr:amidohydrolase [Bacteroidales bacterium]